MNNNKIEVSFDQTIPQRVAKTKNVDGTITEKIVPERKISIGFSTETLDAVNAKNVANYFWTRLMAWQELRPLQGKEGFQTSKSMEVTIKAINGEKEVNLTSEMKFTINPERIMKCLERGRLMIASVAKALAAPEFNANDNVIAAYVLARPEDVRLLDAVPAEPVIPAEVVGAEKPKKRRNNRRHNADAAAEQVV